MTTKIKFEFKKLKILKIICYIKTIKKHSQIIWKNKFVKIKIKYDIIAKQK